MVKVQTGDSSQTDQSAELITNTVNAIQEYPPWLVIAFAVMAGLAIPSPLSSFSHWRQVKRLEKQIETLIGQSGASPPTYTTKPVESPIPDKLPLQT